MTDTTTSAALPRTWASLAELTPARVALGRSGASLPTRAALQFAIAHAQARDAVHAPFEAEAVADRLARLSLDAIGISSLVRSRDQYLRRPDLGRRLDGASREALEGRRSDYDLALVVADGLSTKAVHLHAVPFATALLDALSRQQLRLAPVAVASLARVALGDEVAAALGARLVAVLIGERPGLTAADSLGCYLTFAPRIGTMDAERNCISNIRPGGLSYTQAAAKLAWLIAEARRRALTGVDLKDESDLALEMSTCGTLPRG